MSDKHSILAPSSAPVWVYCPGSVPLSADVTQEETEDSREGDAVHWLAAETVKLPDIVTQSPVGITAPNGVIINDEMSETVDVYIDELRRLGLSNCNIERPVKIPDVHPENWGTPDAWLWHESTRTLYVWDLKYGHGSVIAEENWQLIDYAIGILRELMLPYDITVEFAIVQPRCYDGLGAIRRWSIKSDELKPYLEQLQNSAAEALSGEAMVHVGDHCHHCKARRRCKALTQSTAQYVDYSQSAVPMDLSEGALAYELTVLNQASNLIKYRKEALEAEATSRITKGQFIPGWALQQGWSREKWLKPDTEIAALGTVLGIELMAPAKPITPGQAKKLIDAEVIKSYYGKQPTAMKLVVDDNSRAKRIFKEI